MKWCALSLIGWMLVWLAGCTPKRGDIRVVCVRDEVGNYILKWETAPQLKGQVQIYASSTPEEFDMSVPDLSAKIEEGVTTFITNDNLKRLYFRLVFDGQYQYDVSARYSFMDNIQNFRDLGGYYTDKGMQMRWGMVYRSGSIERFDDLDSIRLHDIGIRTILDLRTEEEATAAPVSFASAKVVRMPISDGDTKEMMKRLRANTLRKQDGILYMEDKYLQFVTQDYEAFGDALHLFLDEANYPILIQDDLGKDRAGFLSSVLLTLLDVPRESVMRDYMASNHYIDVGFFAKDACSMSTDAQETITVLLSAKESFLDIAYEEIDRKYGSFQAYTAKELHFSPDDQTRLREILLK